MHLNPYGEYAVLLAASLANAWPTDRDGLVQRTREFGMTMDYKPPPETIMSKPATSLTRGSQSSMKAIRRTGPLC